MMHLSGSLINFDNFNETDDIRKKAYDSALNGGPNSGFEIDDLDLFKKDPRANEFPEFKDDVMVLVSAEAYVNKLLDFHGRIVRSKGMSRGMSHELLELIPSLESHTSPKHFTEIVSTIGLETSLEALSGKVWAMIIAAMAFVIGLIYKLVGWFTRGSTGDPIQLDHSAQEEWDEYMETYVEVMGAMIDAKKELADKHFADIAVLIDPGVNIDEVLKARLPDGVWKLLPGNLEEEVLSLRDFQEKERGERYAETTKTFAQLNHVPEIKFDMDDLLKQIQADDEIYRVLETYDIPLRLALLEHSPPTEFLIDAVNKFPDLVNMVSIKVQFLSAEVDSVKKHMHDFDARQERRSLDEQHSFENEGIGKMIRSPIQVGRHTFPDLESVVRQLRLVFGNENVPRLMYKEIGEFFSAYINAMERWKRANMKNLYNIFPLLIDANEMIGEAEKTLKFMNGDADVFNDNPILYQRTTELMKLLREIGKDVSELSVLYSKLTGVYVALTKDATVAIQLLKNRTAGIVNFYRRFDQEPPEDLLAAALEMAEINKKVKELKPPQVLHIVPRGSVNFTMSFHEHEVDENGRPIPLPPEEGFVQGQVGSFSFVDDDDDDLEDQMNAYRDHHQGPPEEPKQ